MPSPPPSGVCFEREKRGKVTAGGLINNIGNVFSKPNEHESFDGQILTCKDSEIT